MGFLDVVFRRSKPVMPDLGQLFGLPSAAIAFTPTGVGSVCFAAIEGGRSPRSSMRYVPPGRGLRTGRRAGGVQP